jgi:multidrug efflux system outer membrane protein
MIKQSITVAVASAVLFLTGCATVGNDFKAPANVADATFRHAPQAAEGAASLPRQWWSVFGDATLDRLEQQALADSPTVKAAAQRLLQAEAQLGVTRASERPQLNVNAGMSNSRTSANTSQGIALGRRAIDGNNYSVGS